MIKPIIFFFFFFFFCSIYKHPSRDLNDFNYDYLNNLLEKVSTEQKKNFLSNFNINLLWNYNDHNPAHEFLHSLASNCPKTLINNIFTNVFLSDSLSDNLTATISDHLPQFLIVSVTLFPTMSINMREIGLTLIEKIL